MAEKKTLKVETGGERLDKFLAGEMENLSRSYLQKLIGDGMVTVNGAVAETTRQQVLAGDAVVVTLPAFSGLPASQNKNVPILHEDASLVVVDKPAGWVVHPAGPHQTETLVQRLWPKLSPAWAASVKTAPLHTARPGVVHRLDKGTSGVIVVAKTPAAAANLSAQFAGRTVRKIYWALVHGTPVTETGVIRSTVGRDRRKPHRMSVSDPGRPSELEFKVVARFEKDALLEVHPLTGRTHQIRVQLASLKHPLVGDSTYGGDAAGGRPFLHAKSLSFRHPKTKKEVSFSAPLPPDFKKALKERGFRAS